MSIFAYLKFIPMNSYIFSELFGEILLKPFFFTEMSWTLGSHIHIPLQFNIFWINLLNYLFL